MTHPNRSFSPVHHVSESERNVDEGVAVGAVMQTADDAPYRGRHVALSGAHLLNFGSCSYLSLDQRPEVREGAIAAVLRYGTQFSMSRAFVQLPLYEELEAALAEITGGCVLVTASTTLAHISALPVLVEPGDAVLIDQFAHASLHTAAALLRVPIELVRHSRVDVLERKLAKLVKTHSRVWLLADGLYSMLGDFAPLADIARLLEAYPQLHLYLDDAHSTSWTGKHGRGYGLEVLQDRSRVVVALSLNKAFSAGGGALVFATDRDKLRVRRCGGPMLFSGPLQPPLLGAALASAELHLRPEFSRLQDSLVERIDLTIALGRALGLPLATFDRSPIFFVRCGPLSQMFALSSAMRARGFYASVCGFPAVPQNQSGLRVTISLHNTTEDIHALMETLAAETRRLGIVHEEARAPEAAPSGVMRVSRPPPARIPTSSAPPPA
jgi:7-keto-8-aminopelargonate synthetase-like enzyme